MICSNKENQQKISKTISNTSINYAKGKTWEELYGKEMAQRLRIEKSQRTKRQMREQRIGKTYEEIYGYERAQEIKRKKNLAFSQNHPDFNGSKNPFYGRKHTKESKLRMRISHKGKKLSEDHKKKIGLAGSGSKHWNWVGGPVKLICLNCKLLYFVTPSRIKKSKFCSRYCRGNYYRGEKSWHWKNGKSFEPYPLGWTKTFKEQIRYRDGYKCQLCGVPEAECRRKLDVHHKDYDKFNIKPENLVSLCHSCHMKTNFSRLYWIRHFSNLSAQS